MNAIQGARIAGARVIVALDPVEFKRTKSLEFGATHTAATLEEAVALVADLTRRGDGRRLRGDHRLRRGRLRRARLSLVGKRGRVVVTAIPHPTDMTVDMSLFDLTLYEKQVRGSLFGSSNPRRDIPVTGSAQVWPTQTRRTDHPGVHARRCQSGVRRHALGREHPRFDPLLRNVAAETLGDGLAALTSQGIRHGR